jgi:hypothetical protein
VGDTVDNVAARFGISAGQIRRLNGLSATTRLQPGQSLALVLPKGRTEAQAPPGAPGSARQFEPRYARVVVASPIIVAPSASSPGQILYQPAVHDRLVVSAEQGEYWGVVMIDGSTGWIAKSAAEMTDESVPPADLEILLAGGRPDIVKQAFDYLGTPYRYGGRLPLSVDCSLLVQTVFARRGINLPRTAAAQYDCGQAVNYADMLPGDRVYFVGKSGRINHTGIYIGGGKFIHASARRGRVTVDSLLDRLYWTRFLGARRL